MKSDGSLVVPDSWWVGRALEHPSAWWYGPRHPEGPASFGDLFSALAFRHVSEMVAAAVHVPALRRGPLNRLMRAQRLGDAADEYALAAWSGWEQACAMMGVHVECALDATPQDLAPLWSRHLEAAEPDDLTHLLRMVGWARARRERLLGDLTTPPWG